MRLAAQDVRIGGVLMLVTAVAWPFVGSSRLGSLTCPFLSLTGIPCPLCGMTTSVVATVRLDLSAAVLANPFGPVVVGVAIWLLIDRSRTWVRAPWWGWAAATAASWGFQLARLA